MVRKLDGTRGRAERGRTSGVTLTNIEGEVPRLAVLRAPAIVQSARATAGDVIKLRPESIPHDRTDNEERTTTADRHPVVLTGLVVDLARPVADAAKAKVRASLRLAVERKHVRALANGERRAKHF